MITPVMSVIEIILLIIYGLAIAGMMAGLFIWLGGIDDSGILPPSEYENYPIDHD